MGSPLRAAVRLLLYLAFSLALIPAQALAVLLRRPAAKSIPYWYHQRCCRLLDIRVERRGRQSRRHPTLYVCNHTSYLDITVLGSLIAGSFVAKAEVARWPFFGWLAKLQRTVFVDRRISRTATQRDEMVQRLRAGDDLILFAEGTSNDGNRVLPFKSALFSVAEAADPAGELTVQPVSIAYTKLDGLPMGRHLRPFFAWYGDMNLAPHIWHALGLGRLTVVVHFHRPVTMSELGSRKLLSEYCHREVAGGVSAALSGRVKQPSGMPVSVTA